MTLSPRTFGALLVIAMAGAFIAAAWPDPGAAGAASQHHNASVSCPPGGKARGTVTLSDWQSPDTLNPFQSSQLITSEVAAALFDRLFTYNSSGRLVPQMAASIPTIANRGIRDAGRTVIVRLKSGLRWSNGAAITSADIKFGWQVGMDRSSGPACLGTCDVIASIDLPDRNSAILHLRHAVSQPIPSILPDVWPRVWRGAWTGSPHAAALQIYTVPSFNFESAQYPTDGPYQVASYKSGNIQLRPMGYYGDVPCGARIRKLVFASFASKGDLMTAAAKRRTDITTGYNLSDLPDLLKHPRAYHVRIRTSYTFEHLEFNVATRYGARANPLADTRVRQALALALDRQALIRTSLRASKRTAAIMAAWSLFVHTPDLTQPGVPNSPAGQWDPVSRRYVISGSKAAVADARKLLKQTPYKGGFSLDLDTTSGSNVRQAEESVLATSWARLGIKVHTTYASSATLLAGWSDGGILVRGRFQVALFAYLGSADPQAYRYNLASGYCNRRSARHLSIDGNNGCVHDSLIDRSFADAGRNLSAAGRAADYNAIQLQVNRQAYWIPLYFWPAMATDDGQVLNFSLNPTQIGATWNIAAWVRR